MGLSYYSLYKVSSFDDDIRVSVVVLGKGATAHKSFKTCLSCQLRRIVGLVSVNGGLILFLLFWRRIFENTDAVHTLTVDSSLNGFLRNGKALVHHHLVVLH